MFDTLIAAGVRHPKVSAAGGIFLLAALLVFAWWRIIWQQPQRVFSDMLANNLTTVSVTKQASASSSSQSVKEVVRLQMGSVNAADWLVSATQSASTVVTESIGTPTQGYIRYIRIATQLENPANKPLNFNKVLGVWGKGDAQTDPSLGHVFSQTLLDISSAPLPPIAHMPQQQRQNILSYIQREHIFSPDYRTVKRQVINGRDSYTYTVTVQLGAYVRMMQAFAHDLGLSDLDTVDPSQYATAPPVTLSISVDRSSHQLVRVVYPGSGFSQSYTAWGLLSPVSIPARTVSTTELQRRIQALSVASQ